ncbi:MAG TPA: hybrid sensor histidine kinase/response regulator [Haliangium sp.]|nr:hybrid sensor histidine kinase/response regulator [Haliangium sp.]
MSTAQESLEQAQEQPIVLLVDDTPANLGVLFEHLDEHGYRVLVAEDGEEAMDLAERVRPDVILLDVMMPGIDGFETCQRLKAVPETRDIPVIFMTALTDTRDKVRGFRAGAVDYVTKPVQHEEVLARVRTHVEMRALEGRLRAQNARLEREVAERARAQAALKEHVTMLEAQNAELDAFARTVAHNLKDPLNGLIGFADILADEAGLTGDAAECLQNVIDTAQRMNAITEELLLLARLRAQDVERTPLDMAPIVERSRTRLAPLIAKRKAEVVVSDTWPRALGYASWVEEVWVNYLSNAIKYGGDPPRIELGASPVEDGPLRYVRYWVRDRGPGIAEDARPHLFTEFTRLSQVQIQGYGLGLSIVKRIVDKLGGRVGVDTTAGAGSTFYFELHAA